MKSSISLIVALRFIVGFLAAPLASGILFLFIGKQGEGVWAFTLSAIVLYPAMIIIGLPAYFFLRRLGWIKLWSYMMTGALIGIIVCLFLYSSTLIGNFKIGPAFFGGLLSVLMACVFAAFFGALTAATFRFIARPDRAYAHQEF